VSWTEHLRAEIAELRALHPFDYAAAPADLARLDCNELAFGPTSEELERFARALGKLALQRYPDMSGRPVREALARCWQVDPDEILLGNGSVEILALLMTAFGAGTRGEPGKVNAHCGSAKRDSRHCLKHCRQRLRATSRKRCGRPGLGPSSCIS